ncbi:MAG: O-antigen polymerase [Candidatus Buchananbacteria bacterium]
MAISISQLRLSPNESPWTIKFWIILLSFLAIFVIFFILFSKIFNKKIGKVTANNENPSKIFFVILILMTVASVIVNIYIFFKFGTLPILSSQPDSFRFVINRKLFGLWEYISLLPRLAIPFSVFYLLVFKPKKWVKAALIANIIAGFAVLSLYTSRLVIIFPILISYFSYLIYNLKAFNFRKLVSATVAVIVIVLIISVAIPAFRQSITYRDYNDPNAEKDPFTYISKLSGLKVPKELNFIVPIYIIPTFNLQAMMRAVDFYNGSNIYYGQYTLSTFNPGLKYIGAKFDVKIPFKDLFLPWWVTATYMFSWWADFWYLGILIAAGFLALVLSFVYSYATKKPNFFSIILFSYFSFVTIMTIYTNYFQRSELYIDLAVIIICALILRLRFYKQS